jgi:hypothetical protein
VVSAVMTEHYAGDDTKVKVLLGGILAAYAGMSVEEFERRSDTFLRTAQHPTLGRAYLECAYRPMVDYLEANGFTNYIVSGGGRDFMRPVTDELYGVPRERDRQQQRQAADRHVGDPAQPGAVVVHRAGALQDGDDAEPQRDADREPARQVGGQQRPASRLREQDRDRRQERRVERSVQGDHEELERHLSSHLTARRPPCRHPERMMTAQSRRGSMGG